MFLIFVRIIQGRMDKHALLAIPTRSPLPWQNLHRFSGVVDLFRVSNQHQKIVTKQRRILKLIWNNVNRPLISVALTTITITLRIISVTTLLLFGNIAPRIDLKDTQEQVDVLITQTVPS